MSNQIKMDVECPKCEGTGVYSGMGEREGAFVICWECNGTGKTKITYTPFTGLKKAQGVTRVYLSGYSYCIAPKKLDFQGIGQIDLSKELDKYDNPI